jgi:hypothetical protein
MRFLRSVDESGNLLKQACEKAGILEGSSSNGAGVHADVNAQDAEQDAEGNYVV